MKSQTFQLKSIAPVAVALSLTLAMGAHAQNASSPLDSQQMIASSPIGAANGTMPIALLQSQEPVIDPAEFSAEHKVAESKGWDTAADTTLVRASSADSRSEKSKVENVSVPAAEKSAVVATAADPVAEKSAVVETAAEPVAEKSAVVETASEPVAEKSSADSAAASITEKPADAALATEDKAAVAENTPVATTERISAENPPVSTMERIKADNVSVSATEKSADASIVSTEKSTVVDGLTALSPVEVTPDLRPISNSEPAATTPATDLTDTRAIASTADAGDASESHIQLRGAAAAPNAASSGSDTAGDTSLRQIDIAQASPNDATTGPSPDNREFDLTPVSLPRRTPSFNRMEGFHSNMLYSLPGKLFFSAVVDNSLRCETNVFQTRSNNRTDMVYRVLPNTVLGWALTRKTRVSANYFFLRDQYTKYTLLDRNFHSVGGQIDHDFYAKNGLQVTGGFLARALFANPDQFSDAFFNDLLPSITATKQVGNHAVMYGSIIGQIRFREVLSQFQEGDQFYSLGCVYKEGPWQALGDFTLNNNFGNSNLRQGENNQVIILTEEIARRIPYLRRVPIDAYVRAQQIFNMGAQNSPGYAGVNCRIFGGIRAYISKPPVYPVKLAGK